MMTEVYKPRVSGITNYISLNKKSLEDLGHEVFVFTFGDEDYQDEETNIIRSPGIPLVQTGYYLSTHHKKEARQLLKTMDIVHVHHPFLSGNLALRYCRPRGIPILFTNHTRYDLYAQVYMRGLPEVISEAMIHAYLPAFCRHCDLVIAPSKGLRDVLERLGVKSRIDVVPNGVDLTAFCQVSRLQDRSEYGYDSQDVVLTYVGRLGPEKNLPFLLRTFAGVSEAFEHTHLLIIGDGPERYNLEEQVRFMGIEQKVKFTGMIPYDRLPRYLSVADAFVTASVTEVHPLSVIEAMAAGLPVVGITSPGVGDTVIDGETGFLSNEDLAAYTAKLVRLVSDGELRRKMGGQARKASQLYDIKRTTKLMEEKYEQLIWETRWRKRKLRSRMYRFLDRIQP